MKTQKVKNNSSVNLLIANLKKVNDEIEQRNALFKKASKEEKRVLIAKDVLNLIETNKIAAASNTWVDVDFHPVLTKDTESFREAFLGGKVANCECCALGSMMTSCTLFKNKITVNDYHEDALSYADIEERYTEDFMGFRKIFSKEQLILIEIAFEEGGGYYYVRPVLEDYLDKLLTLKEAKYDIKYDCSGNLTGITAPFVKILKAYKFGKKYSSDKDRLIAIMKNIVKNNGEFKP